MPDQPLISVLMPFYNPGEFLGPALESILHQSLRDFELILINDGSDDGSAALLDSIRDDRLVFYCQPSRMGLSACLKWGVTHARGAYIARMDADDIARPNRFEKQAAYLEAHPDTGLLGSACFEVNEAGQALRRRQAPIDHQSIRYASMVTNPFIHPTMMIRRSVLEKWNLNYDETLPAAQDYDLWTRLLRYSRGANLQEPLLYYRLHSRQITNQQRESQFTVHGQIAERIRREILPNFQIDPGEYQKFLDVFLGFSDPNKIPWSGRERACKIYLELFALFQKQYPEARHSSELTGYVIEQAIRYINRQPVNPGFLNLLRRIFMLQPFLFTRIGTQSIGNRLRNMFGNKG